MGWGDRTFTVGGSRLRDEDGRFVVEKPNYRPHWLLPGGGVDLPATDELARTHAAIPVSGTITEEQVAEVVAAVGAVLA